MHHSSYIVYIFTKYRLLYFEQYAFKFEKKPLRKQMNFLTCYWISYFLAEKFNSFQHHSSCYWQIPTYLFHRNLNFYLIKKK